MDTRKNTTTEDNKLNTHDNRTRIDKTAELYDMTKQQFESSKSEFIEAPPGSGNYIEQKTITPTRTVDPQDAFRIGLFQAGVCSVALRAPAGRAGASVRAMAISTTVPAATRGRTCAQASTTVACTATGRVRTASQATARTGRMASRAAAATRASGAGARTGTPGGVDFLKRRKRSEHTV
jgi:hypothetical protein